MSGKIIKIVLIIFIIIFAVFLGNEYLIKLPKAKQAMEQLKIEFNNITLLPHSKQLHYSASHETSQTIIGADYEADDSAADIFKYYNQQLQQNGWRLNKTPKVTYWWRDLGGKSIYYRKGKYLAEFQYANQRTRYGWKYSLSFSWGLENLDTNSGLIKQSVSVSLSFILFGAIFALISIIFAFKSWTKDSDEFVQWLYSNGILYGKFSKSLVSFFSEKYMLWNSRILSPLAFLMGLFILFIGLNSLWRNIFCG